MTNAIQIMQRTVAAAALVAGMMILLLAVRAEANPVEDLYTVQVPVAGSSSAQLQQGYRDGLKAVLLRASGNRQVFENEGIDEVLADAESLLQSYQYLRADSGQNELRMTFGSVGVTRALAGIGAAVWGANRPVTLAWVAVEDRGNRRLLVPESESGGAWPGYFRDAAMDRGLPLAFPSGEAAADRRLLSEVWGQFMGSIREASAGSQYDFLTAVRVSGRAGGWEASWVMEGPGMDETSSVRADTPQMLARQVIDAWADQLAARYAVAGGDLEDATRVEGVLEGLQTVDDFGAAKRALESMNPVTGLSIASASRERLVFRLGFSGELDQLREYISLDDRFKAMASPRLADTITPPAATEAQSNTGGDTEAEADRDPGTDNATQPEASAQPVAFDALYETLYYRWQGGASRVSEGASRRTGDTVEGDDSDDASGSGNRGQ